MDKRKTTRVLALTLALLCLGCEVGGGTPQGGVYNPDISRRCAEALAASAKEAGVTPSVEGDRVRVGKDEVRLSARVDNDVAAHSRRVLGVMVDVSLNGNAQPLTAGVVGVGDTRDDAAADVAESWARLVGVALLDALGAKRPGKPTFSAGRFDVHAGMAGISADVGWTDDSRRELLSKLGAITRGFESSRSEFHSIMIMVAVKPDGTIDGDCSVDGMVSPEALKAARSFPWPKAANEYMLKQFYVLRRRSP